jgi:hypothetical protein
MFFLSISFPEQSLNATRDCYTSFVDEGRKRLLGIMAAIMAARQFPNAGRFVWYAAEQMESPALRFNEQN